MVPLAVAVLAAKLALGGAGLALLETVSAKMRIFRAPEFLGWAFMLAVLGMLTTNSGPDMSHTLAADFINLPRLVAAADRVRDAGAAPPAAPDPPVRPAGLRGWR